MSGLKPRPPKEPLYEMASSEVPCAARKRAAAGRGPFVSDAAV